MVWGILKKCIIPILIGFVGSYYHKDICKTNELPYTMVTSAFAMLAGFLMTSIASINALTKKHTSWKDMLIDDDTYYPELVFKLFIFYGYLLVIGFSLANAYMKPEIIQYYYLDKIHFFLTSTFFFCSFMLPISVFKTIKQYRNKEIEKSWEKDSPMGKATGQHFERF